MERKITTPEFLVPAAVVGAIGVLVGADALGVDEFFELDPNVEGNASFNNLSANAGSRNYYVGDLPNIFPLDESSQGELFATYTYDGTIPQDFFSDTLNSTHIVEGINNTAGEVTTPMTPTSGMILEQPEAMIQSQAASCFELEEDIVANVSPNCGGAIQMFRDLGSNLAEFLNDEMGIVDHREMIAFFPDGSPMQDLIEAQLTENPEEISRVAHNLAREYGFYDPNNPEGDSLIILRGATFTVSDGDLLFAQSEQNTQTLWDCRDGKVLADGDWRHTTPCGDTPETIQTTESEAQPVETILASEAVIEETQEVIQPLEQETEPVLVTESDVVTTYKQYMFNVCLSGQCFDAKEVFIFTVAEVGLYDSTAQSEIIEMMSATDTNVALVYEIDANGNPTGKLQCVNLVGSGEHARIEYTRFITNVSGPDISSGGRTELANHPREVRGSDIEHYVRGTFDNHGKVAHPDMPTHVVENQDGTFSITHNTPQLQEIVVRDDILNSTTFYFEDVSGRWENIRGLEIPSADSFDSQVSELMREYGPNSGNHVLHSRSEAVDLVQWYRGLSGQHASAFPHIDEAITTTIPMQGETFGSFFDRAIPNYVEQTNALYNGR